MKVNAKRLFNLQSVIAITLIFWCAGAGCMIVSYARAAANDTATASMDHAMDGSMSMDAHACCKAKHRSGKQIQTPQTSTANSAITESNLLTIPSAPPQSGAMSCCPLTSGSMVVASRSQSNDRATVSSEAGSSALLLINSDPKPLAVPLRLPNRAHSYLLDCAFLI